MSRPYFEWQRSFDDVASEPTAESTRAACLALGAYVVGRRKWAWTASLLRAVRARPYESIEECARNVRPPDRLELEQIGVEGVARATISIHSHLGGPRHGQQSMVLGLETHKVGYEYVAYPPEQIATRRMDSTESDPIPEDDREQAVGLDEVLAAIGTVWNGVDGVHQTEEQDYLRFQRLSGSGIVIPNFQVVSTTPTQVQFTGATR